MQRSLEEMQQEGEVPEIRVLAECITDLIVALMDQPRMERETVLRQRIVAYGNTVVAGDELLARVRRDEERIKAARSDTARGRDAATVNQLRSRVPWIIEKLLQEEKKWSMRKVMESLKKLAEMVDDPTAKTLKDLMATVSPESSKVACNAFRAKMRELLRQIQ